ncbi:MAG TPA: hypothetical protein VK815_02015 [Candidatus Acidoferrales bacterium]|jgi:hypothetical protein|nr:hypothetical protein [Candidatus Acidoferrales bacterium]
MTKNEKMEAELAQLLNSAPDFRRKMVLESIEYKLAMKAGAIAEAYDFAYGVIIGSGKTKTEAKRNAKKIKRENFLRTITE